MPKPLGCHLLSIGLLTRPDLDEARHAGMRRQARMLVAIHQQVIR